MEIWQKVLLIFMLGFFFMFIVPYVPVQNNLTMYVTAGLVLISGIGGLYVMLTQ